MIKRATGHRREADTGAGRGTASMADSGGIQVSGEAGSTPVSPTNINKQ